MKKITSIALALSALTTLLADEVITINGSKLVGTVTGISGGTLTLSTDFAGDVQIPMDQVETFSTDDEVTVRLESGDTVTGTVASAGSDSLKVEGSAGTLNTTKDQIRLGWLAGQPDPDIAALERNWTFRAALDLAGSSGNSEKATARVNLEAELEGPTDRLKFFAQHESGSSDGVTNARETKVGARYTNFVSDKWGWFTRVQFENDEFEDLDLRVLGSAGLTYKIFETPTHYLHSSMGLAYQYSDYSTGVSEDLMGLDFGLAHHYEFENLLITETTLSYIPSIEDAGEFILEHSSWVQVPIAGGGRWNIRAGIDNTYVSEPEPGIEELDTLYYTSLVFTWE